MAVGRYRVRGARTEHTRRVGCERCRQTLESVSCCKLEVLLDHMWNKNIRIDYHDLS